MQGQFQERRIVIQGLFVGVAVLLLLKSIHLQLVDKSYQEQAAASVIQKINKYPSRGLIFDRDMNLLVNNEAMYDLMVTYNQVGKMDTAKFCRILGIDIEVFKKNLHKDFKNDRQFSPHKPFVFLSKITKETYARLQESLYEFPGFYAELRNVRRYTRTVGAHVIGYNGEVSQAMIEKDPYYRPGDFIGITGLERSYETDLRGRRGVEYVLRDNLGRIVGRYESGRRDTLAVSGRDLITAIDFDLQEYGEQLIKGKRGAIVAIEPSSGEILAMVSMPSYDPNLLTITRERGKAFAALNKDPSKPLYNRAISAMYPPGSIFKPILALAAMEEGVLKPDRYIGCGGAYYYKNLRVGCHGHPAASDVSKAIQHSCNAYFCQVFRDVVDKNGFLKASTGLDTLVMHLDAFGLGRSLESDIPGEKTGNVPTSAYYDKVYRKGAWTSPYIISMGIGQGELLITPLQMANLTATIANRGYYYPPHLAKAFRNDTTQIPIRFRTKRHTLVSPKYFQPIVDGMESVVLAGTARVAQIPGMSVCGKTGTAENPHGKDHSVFIAFAPKENPKIAVAVFVENGGFGATYAAPIASLMIEKYINKEISKQRRGLEERMLESTIRYERGRRTAN